MDNNKNRMKDRPKSKNELRKIDPTGNSEVGIENGEKIGAHAHWSYVNILDTKSQTFFMLHF